MRGAQTAAGWPAGPEGELCSRICRSLSRSEWSDGGVVGAHHQRRLINIAYLEDLLGLGEAGTQAFFCNTSLQHRSGLPQASNLERSAA